MNPFGKLHTLLDTARLCNLIQYSTRCQNIEGLYCECGVFHGGSLEVIAKFNPDRQVIGFDTFEGIPNNTTEHDFHNPGDFSGVDHIMLSGYFRMIHNNVRIVKGVIPKAFEFFGDDQRFAFVHADVDVFQSVYDCLEYFVPRLNKGGIMILDDFLFRSTPGCAKAINDYFENPFEEVSFRGELKQIDGAFVGEYIIIK